MSSIILLIEGQDKNQAVPRDRQTATPCCNKKIKIIRRQERNWLECGILRIRAKDKRFSECRQIESK